MKKWTIYLACLLLIMAFQLPEKKQRFFLIGDSTMANKPLADNPERGWGQLFPHFLNEQAVVYNHAVNGRSTKSFLREGRWDSVMKQLQPGDYVFIQFGHNDSKESDSVRFAAPHTTYKQNLQRYVNDARSKGAIPVLITPVMRRKFNNNGAFVDQHGDYPGVVKEVSKAMNTLLIDLHASSEKLIVDHGVKGSEKIFLHIDSGHYSVMPEGKTDNTHFSEYGAKSVAALVCAEMKAKGIAAEYLKVSVHPEKMEYELPFIYQPHFKKDTFDIRSFGAVNDGVTLNTKAINQAITACATKGGGTVLIPAGLWMTGPIVLQSKVELHAVQNALILFTPDRTQYPLVRSSFEGVAAARCQSPITAEGLENIAITGKGVFQGSGHVWRPLKRSKLSDSEWKQHIAKGGVVSPDGATWYPSAGALKASIPNNIGKLINGAQIADFEEIRDYLRPNMLRIVDCNNVLIDGVTFENSPAWTMHFVTSKHLTLKQVTVKNPWYGQNTDALDLESCANVLVDGCSFDTGDDGICIKSGRDEEGRKRGIPTENVIAMNTTVYHAHGGFVVGSEMSGGARNLFVSNCNFIGTDIGLRFKTVRGRGGVVENVYAANINMMDIPGEAISFDMYYAAKDPVPQAGEVRELPKVEILPVTEATPVFRKFYINNIVCNGAAKAVFIRGIPEMPVQDVVFKNMVLKTKKGIECTEATGIQFNQVNILPAEAGPVVYLQNSGNISFNGLRFDESKPQILSVNGDRSGAVRIEGTNTAQIRSKSVFNFGAKPSLLELK